MFENIYELNAINDSRQSFYGKAHVLVSGDTLTLRSYSTNVATISPDPETGERVAKVRGTYSATTLRHIKDFLIQNGFRADTKAQIVKDYS